MIVFNPPYLPEEKETKGDIQIVGGKKGYEVIERFLLKAKDYLLSKGKILLLFSSLTDKKMIEILLGENLYDYECLDENSQWDSPCRRRQSRHQKVPGK